MNLVSQFLDALKALAARKGCTASQLALAWVMAQDEGIVPIPGCKRVEHLEENVASLAVTISADERRELETCFAPSAAAGERYPEVQMRRVNL